MSENSKPIEVVVDTWNPHQPKQWTIREHLREVIARKNKRKKPKETP